MDMIININTSIFELLRNIESLNIDDKKQSLSSAEKKSIGSFNEDQYFFRSSSDFFRNSDPNLKSQTSEEFDYFNDDRKKLFSKISFKPSDFKHSSTLGKGGYSKVMKAKHKKTEEDCAIKIIEKNFMQKEKKFYQIFAENEILNMCNHTNIIKLLGSYEDEDNVYLVLELCKNGDLGDLISNFAPFNVELGKFVIAQIVLIIEYLDSMKIVHRDLKPENLVIDKHFQLKLVDFSTATIKGKVLDENKYIFIDENDYLFGMDSKLNQDEIQKHPEIQKRLNIINKQRFVGTAEYMAPEVILMKDVGLYTDLWSLGCIVYQLFMGNTPFHDKTEYLIFQNILNLNYTIDEEIVPLHAQDLIRNLLKTDPKERLGSGLTEDNSFDKLKNHKFFEDFDMKKYFTILEKYLNKTSKCLPFCKDESHEKDTSQSERHLAEEKPKEKILKVGILKKRSRWLYYDKRKLVLFNTPRLDYMEPDSNILKGSIPLTKECSACLVSSERFDLKTPNRDFVFMCKSKYDISPWVTAINDAINNFIK